MTPHRGRTRAPYAQDTIKKLQELLQSVSKTDCIIMMGDFNCELHRNAENCTGTLCMIRNKDSGHGEKILELMRSFDLFVVDTLFKPARKSWGEKKKMRFCNVVTLHIWQKFRQKAKEIGLHMDLDPYFAII